MPKRLEHRKKKVSCRHQLVFFIVSELCGWFGDLSEIILTKISFGCISVLTLEALPWGQELACWNSVSPATRSLHYHSLHIFKEVSSEIVFHTSSQIPPNSRLLALHSLPPLLFSNEFPCSQPHPALVPATRETLGSPLQYIISFCITYMGMQIVVW